MKKRPKAIGTVVLGLYFFPFMLALFFRETAAHRAINFAGSIILLSLSGMVLFLVLKRWEEEEELFEKKYNVFELSENVAKLKSACDEAHKEKGLVERELSLTKEAYAQAVQEKEKIVLLEHEIETLQGKGSLLQEELLIKATDIKTYEVTVDSLKKELERVKEENGRLAFELKTFVRSKSKISRTTTLNTADEQEPEASKILYN